MTLGATNFPDTDNTLGFGATDRDEANGGGGADAGGGAARKRTCTVAETTKSPTRRGGLVGLFSSIASANNPFGGTKPACFDSETIVDVPSLRPSFDFSCGVARSAALASIGTRNLGAITFYPPLISSVVGRKREQRSAGLGTQLAACKALISELFSLNLVKKFPQPHASFVQLRLRITDRASDYRGNLRVLEPLDIVQDEYCAVARG